MKPEEKRRKREYLQAWRLANRPWFIRHWAFERAKKNGRPCTITTEDIVIPEVCPVLGIPLAHSTNGHGADCSPSLDAMVPELGYVPGNVAVISWRANRLKNDGTADEHRKLAVWMRAPPPPLNDFLGAQKASVRGPPLVHGPVRSRLLRAAKCRAKRRSIPFNLTHADIVVPRLCPVLGITLEVSEGRPDENSPSLDRIDPEKGYVRGNVAVISMRANRIKNRGTAEEHDRIAAWMESNGLT